MAQDPEPLEVSGGDDGATEGGGPEVTSNAKAAGRTPGKFHEHLHQFSGLNRSKRRHCLCKYCPHRYISMRPEDVYKHLTDVCTQIAPELRQKVYEQLRTRPL